MWFRFLYGGILSLLSIIYFPKMAFDYFFKKKYRQSLRSRFGYGFNHISGAVPLIWVHAVSMGETKAIIALVKKLKALSPESRVIVSSITETGHQEAVKSIPEADFHVFLPFDFSFIIRPIIRRLRPQLVIISETDLWFNFLETSKEVGARVVLVNGKISERSFKRYRKASFFSKRIFSLLDHICAQNLSYAQLFESLGVPKRKISVTGNLKFDEPYPFLKEDELQEWKSVLGIKKEDFVLVIGSTHDPEEKHLLEQLSGLFNIIPQFKIILVPRHPERFQDVSSLLQKMQIPYGFYSKSESLKKENRIILGDAMGLLKKFYQIAHLAIVAGSFTEKVGGHNILEPCFYGVPVIFGPFMHSQKELRELVLQYQAGKQVDLADLRDQVLDMAQKKDEKDFLGVNGLRLTSEMYGATERTLKYVINFNLI